MQTYTIEAAKADLSVLVHLAANGEEVFLIENNQRLAKLVAADDDETYRRDARSLRGFAKGIDTEVYREKEDRI